MKSWFALFLLSMALFLGCRSRSPIQIGQTREEVRASKGAPVKLFVRATGSVVTSSEATLYKEGETEDVWEWKENKNEYHLKVGYRLDENESRFHPIERASTILFYPDKKEPLRVSLQNFDEARLLCAKGCQIIGRSVYGYGAEGVKPYIAVCPVPDGGGDDLSWWKSTEKSQLCLTVWFDRQSMPDILLSPLQWENFRVRHVNIDPVVPFNEVKELAYWKVQIDNLGNWTPK